MSLSWRTMIPVCLFIQLLPSITHAEIIHPSFTSPEHVVIGDKITLRFSSEKPGKIGSPLTLPNGLQFTYGEILSMPDYYSIVDQSVSLGRSDAERRARFMSSFNSFAVNPDITNEAIKIKEIIYNEQKTVDEGMKNG